MPVKGVDQVNKTIKATFSRLAGEVTDKAMLKGLIIIEGHAMELTPVDTSNLINSRFKNITHANGRTIGRIGFTANYAAYVHEGRQKNWQKLGASNKFLEKAAEDNFTEVLMAITDGYKI
tara:strand:- start:2775 stop:3134 length:360 start_codon:yes stop_codon:yes gene_type:complete